jgi:hypothetical protein
MGRLSVCRGTNRPSGLAPATVHQVMNAMHNSPTVIPASYDALESEVYHLLAPITDRDTEMPPPSSQLMLELECAGLETW